MLILIGLASTTLGNVCSAAESDAGKNVLVIYSFSERSVFDSVSSLESAVRVRCRCQVNFFVEYLEAPRFDDPEFEKASAETLQRKFANIKFDLIIPAAYPALNFVLGHRDQLFPGVPIVFSYLAPGRIIGDYVYPGPVGGHKLGGNMTGVTLTIDVASTVALALRLHPDTKHVAVITNKSEWERYWLGRLQAELKPYSGKVQEIDFVGLPYRQILDKVAALPPRTIVIFTIVPQDSVQPMLGPYDMVGNIGKRLPTYCIFPKLCLNHGGIGGTDYDEKEQTVLTAELASRVLSGERPDDIPIIHSPATTTRVDWRQLRRWNITESALPPGTVIINREPSFWERDHNYIIAASLVVVAQFLWIGALLWQRARKRNAEAILTESEERFQRMANTTPSLVWMCDQEGKVTYLNDRRIEFTGRDTGAGYNDEWTKYVHPDDVQAVLDANAQGMERREKFSKQYRLRRKDGVYRWMFDVAAPRVNGDGSFAGFIGSAADITDQKMAQEALEKVSGQLIEAQEKERSRIARDLHDDICQRLALLSMELEQVNRNGSSPESERHLQDIQLHCSEIAADVQALSHQLHSSKLEYLGVAAAIRGFCKEFAKQYQVSVSFTEDSVPRHLPKDVSLCLFRVAQEALHNAAKYSRATQFAVTLEKLGDEVRLEIRDQGTGFDVEAAKSGEGLGLVSMQERVHLVHGNFSVESSRGKGTRVIADVPLSPENAESSTNGRPASVGVA